MGYATGHVTAQGASALPQEELRRHDLRPSVDAIVSFGVLDAARDVVPSESRALLLVHIEGRSFGIRLGENIREEIRVDQGDAIVVAAHTPFRARLSTPIRALLVEFGEELMRSSPIPLFGRRRGHHALLSGRAARPEGIAGAAGLLARDMVSDAGGFAFRSALTVAIIEGLAHDEGLVRHREETASNYTGAGIERALRLIEKNLAAPLSLESLASEAGISPFHLSRSFRRITGLSIQGYVRERRLKEACRLLAETRKPLAEIAYDCGFSSQSRMTTVFRQMLDITPLAYRNQCWHADDTRRTGGMSGG